MKKKRDLIKRKAFIMSEINQNVLKFIFYYCKDIIIKSLTKKEKLNIKYKLGYKTTLRNYCVVSGRSRGVIKSFKVSRIIFRELGSKGFFTGLKKAS
jgi:ribosomal protein S14